MNETLPSLTTLKQPEEKETILYWRRIIPLGPDRLHRLSLLPIGPQTVPGAGAGAG